MLRIATELVDQGVDPAGMFDAMHRRKHPESADLFSKALGTHCFALGGRYAYASLDKSAMARASRIGFETDAVMEPLRSIEGVEVVALFKELFDGTGTYPFDWRVEAVRKGHADYRVIRPTSEFTSPGVGR